MSYGGDPVNSDTDAVRMLIRDTSTAAPRLHDNEILFVVAENPNVWFAAAAAADIIAGGESDSVVTKKVDDLTLTRGGSGGIAQEYRSLAASLRHTGAVKGGTPFAGGISVTDKADQVGDADWDNPLISLGMHDNPAVSVSTGGGF